MFCPQCATQNIEGASYCRSCGANISLVPQALTGSLPQPSPSDDPYSGRRRKSKRDVEPSLEKGILNLFVGLGFIIASIAIMTRFPAGEFWGWALLIPGFSNLGRGVAMMVGARRRDSATLPDSANNTRGLPANSFGSLSGSRQMGSSVPRTGELRPPVPSVTEGTTRHLGAEAATRHFDPVSGEEKFS
jgi:hypothetical protein